MPNWAIEFHDSIIDSIVKHGNEYQIHFSGLYLHKRASSENAETTWRQNALMTISDGSLLEGMDPSSIKTFPLWIDQGSIEFKNVLHSNCVFLPIDFNGDVKLYIQTFEIEDRLVFEGSHIGLQLEGEPEFVEVCRHGDNIFSKA